MSTQPESSNTQRPAFDVARSPADMPKPAIRTVATICAAIALAISNVAIGADLVEKTLKVGQATIPYTEAGQGTLLVLLHGGLSNHRSLDEHLRLLAQDYRVVAFPLRLFDDGAWGTLPKGIPYFEQTADDVATFIETLNSGPAHIAGLSHGSHVAHLTALRHPEKIRSAFLFEGVHSLTLDPEAAQARSKILGPIVGPVMRAAKESDSHTFLLALHDAVSGRPNSFSSEPEAIRRSYERFAPSLRQALLSPTSEPRPCEATRQSTVPILLARGDRSSAYFQEELADKYWQDCVDIVTIQGADHFWSRDATAFAARTKAFAAQH